MINRTNASSAGIGFLDGRYVNVTGDTMTGGLTIKPSVDTLTALVVNDKDSNNVLTVDTINNKVGIGLTTPGTYFVAEGGASTGANDGVATIRNTADATSPTLVLKGSNTTYGLKFYSDATQSRIYSERPIKFTLETSSTNGFEFTYPTNNAYSPVGIAVPLNFTPVAGGPSDAGGSALKLNYTWTPQSTGANWLAGIYINPTINQVSGHTGISRGIYINPTLTSAADWRGLDIASLSATSYSIYTNVGLNRLGDQLSIIGSSDRIQQIIKANATQTANLVEHQNSSGTVLSSITKDGYLAIGKTFSQHGGYANVLDLSGGIAIQRTDDSLGGYAFALFDTSATAISRIFVGNSTSKTFSFYNDVDGGQINFFGVPTGGASSNILKLNSSTSGQGNVNIFTVQDRVSLMVRGISGQTTNLQEWQNSSGTLQAAISGVGGAGFGVTPSVNNQLKVYKVYTDTVDVSGALNSGDFSAYLNPTSSSAANVRGFNAYVGTLGSQTITGSVQGFRAQIQHNNTATLTSAYGSNISASNINSGVITTLYGSCVNSGTTNGNIGSIYGYWVGGFANTGTVTSYYGFRGEAPTTATGGAITNVYGLYLANMSVGTTLNYAIYTNAGINRLGDQLSIVGSSDKVQLIVKGNATQTTNLQEWQTSGGSVYLYVGGSGNINQTVTSSLTSGNFRFAQFDNSINAISASSAYFFGQNSLITVRGSSNYSDATNGITAYQMNADHAGTGTVNLLKGAGILLRNTTTGIITTAVNLDLAASTNLSTGSIGTLYGLRIGNMSSATTNYAIYTNAGLNRLGDQLSIVGSADRIQLLVKGNATQTTNLQEWQNSGGTVLSSVNGGGGWGMGTTPNADGRLMVQFSPTSSTADSWGVYSAFYPNYSADTSNALYAVWADIRPAGPQNYTGKIAGVGGRMYHNGSGTLTSANALSFYIGASSTGNVTSGFGIEVGANSSGSGKFTTTGGMIVNTLPFDAATHLSPTGTAYGVNIGGMTAVNGAKKYGVFVGNISGATNNYAIYTNAGSVKFNAGGDGNTDFQVQSDTEANMLFLDADGDTDGALYLGGTTNGIKINKGGELTLLGTATVWDDLRVEPIVRSASAKSPSFSNLTGGVYLYYFDDAAAATEKEVHFTVQMPHGWKEGSTIEPHVHWLPVVGGSAGNVVKWVLEYTKAKIGSAFGATTTVSGTTIASGNVTVANSHCLTALGTIDMTGDTISTVLICRLYRNSSDAADTLAQTAGLLYIDFHYEADSMGSKTDLAK